MNVAGKMQTLIEMIQAGLINHDQAREILNDFCPSDFADKYSRDLWDTLSRSEKTLIRDKGIEIWEKTREYNNDFDKIVNND